ncbi:MAG: hypothetical protein WCJ33_07855 [Pseudomonadota bacterium]
MKYSKAIDRLKDSNKKKKEKRELIRWCMKHGEFKHEVLDKITAILIEQQETNT